MKSILRIFSLVLLAFAAGCGSLGEPASASFASVTIENRTPEEIASMTAKVFREEGFSGSGSANRQMVFQREGSRGDTIAYEGLIGSHYGNQTLIRVKADLIALEGGAYRLQCQAYAVTDAQDPFFSEEKRMVNMRSGPYQSLLDKVAKRLK